MGQSCPKHHLGGITHTTSHKKQISRRQEASRSDRLTTVAKLIKDLDSIVTELHASLMARARGNLRAAHPAASVRSSRHCFFLQARFDGSFRTDARVDFLAVNRHILRRIDPDTHLMALEAEYGDRDVVADPERFALSSGQYQHESPEILLFQLFYYTRRDAGRATWQASIPLGSSESTNRGVAAPTRHPLSERIRISSSSK
jgi:hypothetical protein